MIMQVSSLWLLTQTQNLMFSLHLREGAQATSSGQKAFNGQIGNPAGVSIITADIVPVSYALFVVPKTCATWKELMPLSTNTESSKFHGDKIEACEYGVTEVHEPKQIVLTKILE